MSVVGDPAIRGAARAGRRDRDNAEVSCPTLAGSEPPSNPKGLRLVPAVRQAQVGDIGARAEDQVPRTPGFPGGLDHPVESVDNAVVCRACVLAHGLLRPRQLKPWRGSAFATAPEMNRRAAIAEQKNRFAADTRSGRMTQPSEIAGPIAWLAKALRQPWYGDQSRW